jgi:ribosome-associated protein
MTDTLTAIVLNALEDLKAKNVTQLNVEGLSDVTDQLIIASGTSSRHVKSLAAHVIMKAKKEGYNAIGIEGIETADWVLVDFGDTVINVMLPQTRDLYDLEGLWTSVYPHDKTM